jgi:hypothetical protein
MAKIKKEELQKIGSLQVEMSNLTTDKIKETAPKAIEKEIPSSLKERAKLENVIYVEPKTKIPPISKLDPKFREKRDRDWEYIKGTYYHENVNGRASTEPMRFWFQKWPGDPYCQWEVPAGKPVYVPRMIARHLAGEKDPDTGMEAMKYHTFDFIADSNAKESDQFTHQFRPTATHYTGRFITTGSFA